MTKSVVIMALSLSYGVVLIRPACLAQPNRIKTGAAAIQTKDKSIVPRVDSLTNVISKIQTELTKLQKQNLELSEQLKPLESARTQSGSNSSESSISLIQVVVLVLAGAVGAAGAILYHERRRGKGYGDRPSYLVSPEVNHRLTQLDFELKQIKERQRSIEETIRLFSSEASVHSAEIEPEPPARSRVATQFPTSQGVAAPIPEPSALQGLVLAYNGALRNEEKRSGFRDQYRIVRIGVQNAVERRRDSNVAAIFQTASDGDYYAIEIRDQGRLGFAVVPRFDLTLQESTFLPGAFGSVFRCVGFDAALRYRRFRLTKPAFFAQGSGENWVLVEKGELQIGEAE